MPNPAALRRRPEPGGQGAWRIISALAAVAAYAGLFYGGLQLLVARVFDVRIGPGTWPRDLLAHLVLGLALFAIARSWKWWALSYSLLVTLLQISCALKMNILGSPLMPDDFLSFSNMLRLFDDWRRPAMAAAALGPLIILLAATAWTRRITWITLALAALVCGAAWLRASQLTAFMDKHFGDWVWNQPGNYQKRGLVLHLLHEGLRNMARSQVMVTRDQVSAALKASGLDSAALTAGPSLRRHPNIYFVLLESFWDPMLLDKAGIDSDPLDPRFRDLWARAGFSTTSAPVYGGYTANSEFEMLCGFPVTQNAVFFEGWLRNDAPCLPRYLEAAGYATIAAHPNHAAFWNRVNCYRRIGFQHYWSKNDFKLDDMNRNFLSDASLLRQAGRKLKGLSGGDSPFFIYIVTFFGHLDYPLSASRPEVISVGGDNKMLRAFVNTMYYKSREVMDWVAALGREDPDALVVLAGDHLPFLGPNHQTYVQAGLFTQDRADFDAGMFQTYVTTPLIVIDGRRGPQRLGHLPMYQLPGYLLGLLGDGNGGILGVASQPQFRALRPLEGLTLFLPERHAPLLCKQQQSQDPRCRQILENTRHLTRLRDDIFTGRQYSLAPPAL